MGERSLKMISRNAVVWVAVIALGVAVLSVLGVRFLGPDQPPRARDDPVVLRLEYRLAEHHGAWTPSSSRDGVLLSALHEMHGEIDGAREFLLSALVASEKSNGYGHHDTRAVRDLVAAFLLEHDGPQATQDFLATELAECRAFLGPDHPAIAWILMW
jgi:hypothetical protein